MKIIITCLFGLISFLTLSQKIESVDLDQVSSDSILSKLTFENPLSEISIDFTAGDSILRSLKLKPKGEIKLSHNYGLISGFISEGSDPLNVLQTNGRLNSNLLGLPVQVGFQLRSYDNPVGINNYFRVSFDKERFKNLRSQLESKKNEVYNDQIKEINSAKSELSGKLGLCEVYKKRLEIQLSEYKDELLSYQDTILNRGSAFKDSSLNEVGDSSEMLLESVKDRKSELEEKYDSSKKLYDSINTIYTKGRDIYKKYEENVGYYQSLKNGDLTELTDSVSSTYREKVKEKIPFIKHVQKLGVGLTYPKVSSLSTNTSPVQGVNFEYQKDEFYLALSSGVTLNNLNLTSSAIENDLNNVENLFNQFDFQQIKEKRFVSHLKSGFGKVEDSHIHFGSYFINKSASSLAADSSSIPVVGLELDVRLKSPKLPNIALDFVLNKTSNSFEVRNGASAIGTLFSDQRTFGSLIKLTKLFPKFKSSIEVGYRILDPFSDAKSLGVVQSNNVRYEFKSIHKINRVLNFGFNVRKDSNNVTGLSDTTTTLYVFGVNAFGSIKNKLNYTLNYQYLDQSQRSTIENGSTYNYIRGGTVSYDFKLMKLRQAITVNYNDVVITTLNQGVHSYLNYGASHNLLIGKSTNVLSFSRLESVSVDSTLNSSFVMKEEFKMLLAKTKVSIGASYSISEELGNSWGGLLKVSRPITKNVSFNISAEKFVLGNFYNSFNRELYDSFPYLITTEIKYNL